LKKDKPLDKADDNTYFLLGEKQKNLKWIFVADIRRNLLWVEVNYPDWAGN